MGSAGQILILSYGGLKEKVFLIYRSRHVQGCQDPSFLENSGQINGIMASHCQLITKANFHSFFSGDVIQWDPSILRVSIKDNCRLFKRKISVFIFHSVGSFQIHHFFLKSTVRKV